MHEMKNINISYQLRFWWGCPLPIWGQLSLCLGFHSRLQILAKHAPCEAAIVGSSILVPATQMWELDWITAFWFVHFENQQEEEERKLYVYFLLSAS